jgi:hypothetical protein
MAVSVFKDETARYQIFTVDLIYGLLGKIENEFSFPYIQKLVSFL